MNILCLTLVVVLVAVSSAFASPTSGHPHGSPVNIIQFTANHSLDVAYDKIHEIFTHPEVAQRKVVVVSIFGASKRGKSFFMDYCLRFMYANYKSVNFMNNPLEHKTEWIGDEEAPLIGFTTTKVPKGVVLWSDAFLYDGIVEGKTDKIAIILMDTTGLSDDAASFVDNSKIFSLGTLLSSMQIFNLIEVIQGNQLEYLQFHTDYSKLFIDNTLAKKPFQHLLFLLRDWPHDHQYSYGSSGGEQYLTEVLKVKDDQSPALKDVRQNIGSTFDKLHCFLMPHPGPIVTERNYDGHFSPLGDDFKEKLKELIEWMFAPQHLEKKRILNSEVTGQELEAFFKTYFGKFQSQYASTAQSIYDATVAQQ